MYVLNKNKNRIVLKLQRKEFTEGSASTHTHAHKNYIKIKNSKHTCTHKQHMQTPTPLSLPRRAKHGAKQCAALAVSTALAPPHDTLTVLLERACVRMCMSV